MTSLRGNLTSTSRTTFQCRWANCDVDLTNSKQSFAHHIREDHIKGSKSIYSCEWILCSKGGFVFQSQGALMSHIQSEHTKEKYFRCTHNMCDLYFQNSRALEHHRVRCHLKQSLSSTRVSFIVSRSSLYNPSLTNPQPRRSVTSFNISVSNPGAESNQASNNRSLIQTIHKKVVEKIFSIIPRSPSGPRGTPFAYAHLNNLSGKIREGQEVGGGSFADVYMAYWVTGKKSTKVAVKKLRSHIYSEADIPKLEKRLRREMRIWGNLDHPNIVPFLGVTSDFGKFTAMVCQWMNQGTLSEYLDRKRHNLNPQSLLNICIAIAHGLSYLHLQRVIHGDLTPGNILMDDDVPHLSDFGLSNVIAELQGPSFLTSKVGGSIRWIAPELLPIFNPTPELTMSCDVYSFASIACFITTGVIPYENSKSDPAIIVEILTSSGISPSTRAQSLLANKYWDVLMMCWAINYMERPSMKDVAQRLQRLIFS